MNGSVGDIRVRKAPDWLELCLNGDGNSGDGRRELGTFVCHRIRSIVFVDSW
jgi:hypothetical protein